MPEVTLPNNWRPRNYQMDAWAALERGIKRALLVWHRRAGKDDVCLHWAATQAIQRAGNYWHMLPQYEQARKSVWQAVNPHTGKRRIDEAFPASIRKRTREDQMMIEFVNGSTWQLVGSDNYNSLVGSPPVGVTASEWALADPSAWGYLSPILRENGGWAVFISTPRGRNHLCKMFEGFRDDAEWFVERKGIYETKALTPEQIDASLREYISTYGEDHGRSMFAQEYECSFDAAIVGAYYARELERADRDGRIVDVPIDPAMPVNTVWDLGINDSTSIIFWQALRGGVIRIVDYYEAAGYGLDHYANVLRQRGYNYGKHYGPHDLEVRELGTGKSRIEIAASLGIPFSMVPNMRVEDGINAARMILPRCWFDQKKTARLRECLSQYREKHDEKRGISLGPLHDWTSHAADAFRYLSLVANEPMAPQLKKINYTTRYVA